MADSYIDADYIKANLGTGVYDAIAAVAGQSFTQAIYSATALIQGYLRAKGYSTPTTTSDEIVKLACGVEAGELISGDDGDDGGRVAGLGGLEEALGEGVLGRVADVDDHERMIAPGRRVGAGRVQSDGKALGLEGLDVG